MLEAAKYIAEAKWGRKKSLAINILLIRFPNSDSWIISAQESTFADFAE